MSRFITVSIDCRNDAVRRTFEEMVSSRRGYLVTKGQGTGAVGYVGPRAGRIPSATDVCPRS